MWKSVALPIRIGLINNPARVHTPGSSRGSEIVVRKLRVYINGMLWLRERLPLEPGERESAPIWPIQTGVLLWSPLLWRNGSGEIFIPNSWAIQRLHMQLFVGKSVNNHYRIIAQRIQACTYQVPRYLLSLDFAFTRPIFSWETLLVCAISIRISHDLATHPSGERGYKCSHHVTRARDNPRDWTKRKQTVAVDLKIQCPPSTGFRFKWRLSPRAWQRNCPKDLKS
jgi:hypothetical protein